MKSRIWAGCACGVGAILGLLSGSWYLLGGPYDIAYLMLGVGLFLLIAAVALVASAFGGAEADTSSKEEAEHSPDKGKAIE